MEREQDRDWTPDEPSAVSGGALRHGSPGVEIDARGRAVIAGTTVEAHRIAALLDGAMDVDEVLRDYGTLDRAQVLAAKAYADEHPWVGPPYPRLTGKRPCGTPGSRASSAICRDGDDQVSP